MTSESTEGREAFEGLERRCAAREDALLRSTLEILAPATINTCAVMLRKRSSGPSASDSSSPVIASLSAGHLRTLPPPSSMCLGSGLWAWQGRAKLNSCICQRRPLNARPRISCTRWT
eukprot:2146639-Alexandrium_andersonii.AAC.1